MPQVYYPGAADDERKFPTATVHDCSFADLVRWDISVAKGDAPTREKAAEWEAYPIRAVIKEKDDNSGDSDDSSSSGNNDDSSDATTPPTGPTADLTNLTTDPTSPTNNPTEIPTTDSENTSSTRRTRKPMRFTNTDTE